MTSTLSGQNSAAPAAPTLESIASRSWDAIVIGAGVMGLSSAWTLAEMGLDVLVLEREAPGAGASNAAAGMLAPYAEIEFDEDDLLVFAEQSQHRWAGFADELEAASAIDVEYDTTGTILLALDPDSKTALERDLAYQRSRGADVAWIGVEECRALEPLLSPYISGGVRSRFDVQVSNRQTVKALTAAAQRSGAQILCGVEAAAVHAAAGVVGGVDARRVGPDGAAIGSPQRIVADRVVLAAGAWSKRVDGLHAAPPIRPVKGQMMALSMPEEHRIRHVIRGPDAYLVPKRDGTLVVGGTQEEMGFDTTLTVGGLFENLRGAWETLPVAWEFPVTETWVGFRPGSRDNAPLLGVTEIDGLFVVTGHFRNGIQQLAGTRDAMRAVFHGGALPSWAAPLHAKRFMR